MDKTEKIYDELFKELKKNFDGNEEFRKNFKSDEDYERVMEESIFLLKMELMPSKYSLKLEMVETKLKELLETETNEKNEELLNEFKICWGKHVLEIEGKQKKD